MLAQWSAQKLQGIMVCAYICPQVLHGPLLLENGFVTAAMDPRAPDIIIRVVPGTIYTTQKAVSKQSLCMEHGGINEDDRHVGLIVSGPSVRNGVVVTQLVSTSQVAPTILTLLGISPNELQAVVQENTQILPKLFVQAKVNHV